MLHVMVLRYLGSPDLPTALVAAHVAYLERAHTTGRFLLSGQTVPDTIGGVILAVGPREGAEALAVTDPFVTANVAEYEIITVDPARVHDCLRDLLAEPGPADPWDDTALTRLRTGDLTVLGEGRPLRPVLQKAGELLLTIGPAKNAALARRCAQELDDRGWDGDDLLRQELLEALGTAPRALLRTAPVSLEDLGDALNGDPLQGNGAIDLRTGDIYHPGTLDYDRPAELDEENDAFDPDRWLFFHPESRGGYRDMADFTAGLPDGTLSDRLDRALNGRGPFRRFRDVLHESGEAHLTNWHLFSAEREIGRARAWLAEEGYRAAPSDTPADKPQHGQR